MHVEEFSVLKSQKVSDAILSSYPGLGYGIVKKILRQKDVKVNGKRVSQDIVLNINDKVLFYIDKMPESKLEVLYEDENICVVFKPRKIETVTETNDLDLLSKVKSYLHDECYAVHRLDRNTEGLVVFAKNIKAKNSLDFAFKNRTLEKFYLALIYGKLEKSEDKMIAYLKKFSDKSYVDVSNERKAGYEKIQTNYKLVDEFGDASLVEVELVTGKTHQIRAHFAHIGHFVIGDEKYGDSKINKIYKKRYQCLCAYKLIFHFGSNDFLSYLDGKEIVLDKNKIDFCQNL